MSVREKEGLSSVAKEQEEGALLMNQGLEGYESRIGIMRERDREGHRGLSGNNQSSSRNSVSPFSFH
jgi:hypothetical protein